ncbi:ABC transporter ATP-binding protein [Nonomuraea sediminis]|uniref:ABC transporter ATP-binding protein n=1 Tax=Nonomuraea sediminis TaxID=2835864 RepID=UPI001BDCFB70|nr:ABC transporter ATP-binding protein [Nonomuraea sediminis]
MLLFADELYRFHRSGDEEVKALRGVSIEVEPGEIVAVTGPSGAGKSTLISCLAGLDEPDGGAVWVAGTRISHRPERERAALRARHIGVVLQSGNLVEHLSVRGNIDLAQRFDPARNARARTESRHWRDELLERVGLADRALASPAMLSGGEAARAGLAVALANKPSVLLADEPTGELDRGREADVLRLVRELAGDSTAVVIASHSAAVRRFADRMVSLLDGRVR